jgi:hypothetical protein
MSNQIRPVSRAFDLEEAVIVEIAIESAVSSFTWVVFQEGAGEPVPVAWGWRPKGKSTRRPASEHSITVRGSDDNLLGEGDYLLRLYDGRPDDLNEKDPDEITAFAQSADLLDEDAFTVTGQDIPESAGTEQSDIGTPIRVALVREGPSIGTTRSAPVTFDRFREFLADRWGDGEKYDDANAWPAFGSKPYEDLRDAARDFVGRSTVRDFADLIPAGYEEGKLRNTEMQFPTLGKLPRNAKTAYLPGVELIWNYWLEEGMLVQTLNVILARFQNRRIPGRDPLSRFDITPLLPLRNRLWGYTEDEVHRMTVRRRAVEYEYEYGLPLIGRAIPNTRALVERRSGFLEAFHQVLFLAHQYFKELDDLTVQADAFPLYRALRDCHIVLSQGTQNQYGEMAVAARAEFLVMQSILAEPQMREFLGGRPMTPYPEPWMDRVDAMKSIQGWTDTSIMNFNDLATIGEQLVLTIRLGNWADNAVNVVEASSWAQAFRAGIQQYAAAYRTATGVDLAREANAELPSTLLARKLAGNRIRA